MPNLLTKTLISFASLCCCASLAGCGGSNTLPVTTDTITPALDTKKIHIGNRPIRIAGLLQEGDLKSRLQSCNTETIARQRFSIGHRGAPLGFPEHTKESYIAAANQGAGLVECDVTFTKDEELVCRHSQCDLHTTTNILETPLAKQCSVAPNFSQSKPFENVRCCTTDITLEEFNTLEGRHDSVNRSASNLTDYYAPASSRHVAGGPDRGELMTHAESIQLFDELGVGMVPELKQTLTASGAENFPTRKQLADKLVAEYTEANIDPSNVFIQSFIEDDLTHLRTSAPEFAQNLVLLDDRFRSLRFDSNDPSTWQPSMQQLADSGLRYLAPPLWMLLTLDNKDELIPSAYAKQAQAAGLKLIAWTLERSGNLSDGGGFYYKTVSDIINNESDMLVVLDALVSEVGVEAVFSDWPATTTYYAHCLNDE